MPTGYTDGITSGKITNFKEYALICARNFGACVMLRDEPLSHEIPEQKPSTHKDNEIKNREELNNFNSMSLEDKKKKFDEITVKQLTSLYENITRINKERELYEKFLIEAKKYKPPTKDHSDYGEFLVNQLEITIDFDCNIGYYEEKIKELESITFKKWNETYVSDLKRDIAYHKRQYKTEVDRVNNRNKWINDLKKSLEGYE